jgi:hypothetical protein
MKDSNPKGGMPPAAFLNMRWFGPGAQPGCTQATTHHKNPDYEVNGGEGVTESYVRHQYIECIHHKSYLRH